MKMTWLYKFSGLFFIPVDSQAKSALQLISMVLPFHPLYFPCVNPIPIRGVDYAHHMVGLWPPSFESHRRLFDIMVVGACQELWLDIILYLPNRPVKIVKGSNYSTYNNFFPIEAQYLVSRWRQGFNFFRPEIIFRSHFIKQHITNSKR